jgi:basic membrane protein A
LLSGRLRSRPRARARPQHQLRVGYVVSAGETPDRSELFGLPYDAFIRSVEALGIEGRVLQVAPNQDAQSALTFLARQRYDLVIMGIPEFWSVAAVAPKYPDTRFLFPDFPVQALLEVVPRVPKNVQGTVFRAEEAGYLAGYMSGLMEKRRPGRDVIGSVGGWKNPGVDRWIVGYQAGARKAAPGIITLNTYAKSFSNFAKCRAVALDQIAKGAGAIFNVAGGCGFGALEAARERGTWGVGVDVDQSYLGPHILTSAVIARAPAPTSGERPPPGSCVVAEIAPVPSSILTRRSSRVGTQTFPPPAPRPTGTTREDAVAAGDGSAILFVTSFVLGWIRTTARPCVIQTASSPAATKNTGSGRSGSAFPKRSVASTAFSSGSMRNRLSSLPPATHTDPKPTATEFTSAPRPIVSTTSWLSGSIRNTVPSSAFPTQTASSSTAIETGRPPIGTSPASFPPSSRTATESGATVTADSEPLVIATTAAAIATAEEERSEHG